MVVVAQLVEHSVVVRVVVGSSPIDHPTKVPRRIEGFLYGLCESSLIMIRRVPAFSMLLQPSDSFEVPQLES